MPGETQKLLHPALLLSILERWALPSAQLYWGSVLFFVVTLNTWQFLNSVFVEFFHVTNMFQMVRINQPTAFFLRPFEGTAGDLQSTPPVELQPCSGRSSELGSSLVHIKIICVFCGLDGPNPIFHQCQALEKIADPLEVELGPVGGFVYWNSWPLKSENHVGRKQQPIIVHSCLLKSAPWDSRNFPLNLYELDRNQEVAQNPWGKAWKHRGKIQQTSRVPFLQVQRVAASQRQGITAFYGSSPPDGKKHTCS